jgi:glycosyltransferase involved in cell wall biosynthesis
MVSTFPPTACGLATFTQALVTACSSLGTDVDVVRVVDAPQQHSPAGVALEWVKDAPDSRAATAAALNRYDVVVIQHEYGIYGGADGKELLSVLDRLAVPVVTVLHTVLRQPTERQHRILNRLVRASAAVVTMTRTARVRAVQIYGANPSKVHVIPHGAADSLIDPLARVAAGAPSAFAATVRPSKRAPLILTWGLLGPGKGIEWGIRALGDLRDLSPQPIYMVAGRTHPKVYEHAGERYRRQLEAVAAEVGVSAQVVFDDRYLEPSALHAVIRSSDIVLLPYDSREQVTSGVLSEAVAAGKPVISTRFPHATELLGDGAGLLVERGDPAAIAAAVRRLVTEPSLAQQLSTRANGLAPALSWRAVADRHLRLCAGVSRSQRSSGSRATLNGGTIPMNTVVV